jgi:tripartite-type tricarboxylate transporter receptor subunit TctC
MVVPSPAGGTTDVVARIFSKKMQELLGQPIIIDNRSGANGYIGTQYVLRAPKDGYTLVVMSGSLHSFTPAMVEKMPFDPVEDFAPVSRLIDYPYVLVTSSMLPYRSVKDLVAAGTAKDGNLSYASYGLGSGPHLVTEWFKGQTGVKAIHIPYKGGGQSAADVMSGQVSFMFTSLPAAVSQITGGRVRALAVTSAKRHRLFPDLPPVADTVPGFDMDSWLGVAAAKGTPASIIEKLRQAIQTTAKDPAVIRELEGLGATPKTDVSTKEFHDFMVGEIKKWDKVAREANIPKEKE